MIPTSDDFSKFIYSAGREQLTKVEVSLASGAHLTLTDYDPWKAVLKLRTPFRNPASSRFRWTYFYVRIFQQFLPIDIIRRYNYQGA